MRDLSLTTLRQGYLSGELDPRTVIGESLAAARADRHHGWIHVLSDEEVEAWLARLDQTSPQSLPLYGTPFAIKDNIDLAGVPTTAACPAYRYTPERSAFVVQALLEAGAIPIGKTNLDQFATGLVGVRSPYGAGRNAFDPQYISGGSSAGSATATALGQVSFALGTDTAGSGRVPAAFNNLIGLKPTRGLLSTSGVVPACRSLDCVSVFALCAHDAQQVMHQIHDYDADDPYSRQDREPQPGWTVGGLCIGVPRPEQREFFGNGEGQRLFEQSLQHLRELGTVLVEIDLEPFLQAARLLYEGPWVAERYHAIAGLLNSQPEALHPITRQIISAGDQPSAVDAFAAQYRLQALRRKSEASWQQVAAIITPTAADCYTIAEVEADPLGLNSRLGHYTNFMNLLDLSAVAVPAGLQANGLPFGVTLFAPANHDDALLQLADALHRTTGMTLGSGSVSIDTQPAPIELADDTLPLAVCGAHLSGLALNHQLLERQARLLQRTTTSAAYRLYALPGGPPLRPGLIRVAENGVAIEVEVWAVPERHIGSLLATLPAPLGLGKVELAGGEWVSGFICEGWVRATAEDISQHRGWRHFLQHSG